MKRVMRQIEEMMGQLDFIISGVGEDSCDAGLFRTRRDELEVFYSALRVRKLTMKERVDLRDLLGALIKFLLDWYTNN